MFNNINKKLSLFFFSLGVIFIIASYLLPKYPMVPVDADIIPMFLGSLLSLLSIFLYFVKDQSLKDESKGKRLLNRENYQVALFIIAILLYILLLESVGFIIVTGLFIFSTSYLLGYRRFMPNILTSLSVPLFFYFSFTYLLKIQLPKGILFF